MDNIADPDITFDENGICNYYHHYKEAEKLFVKKGEEGGKELRKIIESIRVAGKGKKYDCIIGVSGGVDSTYVAYIAKEFDLRVLCVHFDNGWNSELAVQNIENIISKCGFDLYTYVINWEEFKDIQLSYFKANVIDIEAVTDIAINDALKTVALQFDVKFILDGNNICTEFTLPASWINKNPNNLYQVHQRFGTIPLNHYPAKFKKGKYIHRSGSYESIPILNYVEYDKRRVKEIITTKLEWKDYGGKHYESVFTRFYQGYILPNKFKVDKRKAHLSNLIFAGQITKEEAIKLLEQPIYPVGLISKDQQFVLKKIGLTEADFEKYIETKPESHSAYGGDLPIHRRNALATMRMKLGAFRRKYLQSGES